MTKHAGVSYADPKNTFLKSTEVIRRYRWGRTKGYQMLRSPGFPRAIGGAYRLDTLADWEDRQLTGVTDPPATAATPATAARVGSATPPETTPDTTTASTEGVEWSPSTRRPATRRRSANTQGGQ